MTFTESDLRSATSKRWKKPLCDELRRRFDGLVADPVGSYGPERPHPIVMLFPERVGPLLTGASRMLAGCMSAKLFVALGNGGAASVFDLLAPSPPGSVRVACGFLVERAPIDPVPGPDDRPPLPYSDEWDWPTFESWLADVDGAKTLEEYLAAGSNRYAAVSRFHEGRTHTRFRVDGGSWTQANTDVRDDAVVVDEPVASTPAALEEHVRRSASSRNAWVAFWAVEEEVVPMDRTDLLASITRRLADARPFLDAVTAGPRG